MIKLFGWEVKTDEQISETREKELVWIRRRKNFGNLMAILKHVAVR